MDGVPVYQVLILPDQATIDIERKRAMDHILYQEPNEAKEHFKRGLDQEAMVILLLIQPCR